MRITLTLTPSPLTLEGVQVTASLIGADPLGITQSTVELSGRALERSLGANVAQTLSTQPGLAVRYAGPGASAPAIRGLTGERIVVLQDGQRAADLSSTSPDHGLSVDQLSATRIEVVRGPASLLYGDNALGGAVNVISNNIPTVVPSHVEGYVATQVESANPGGALSGSVSVPLGSSLGLTVRASGRNLDDVRVGGGGRLENSYSRNLPRYAGSRVRG